ncbi:MAG: sensor histidine kinase [Marmoricola sp.]|nr:sensor histidine kinase [Marmoricola sp.]
MVAARSSGRTRVPRWWRAATLRGRLTVGMVLVLLVACAVLGVTSELFVRGVLLRQLDAQLVAAGSRYSVSLEHPGDPGAAGTGPGPQHDADDSIPGQSVGTLGVRVVKGKVTEAAVVTDAGTNRSLTLSPAATTVIRSVRPGAAPISGDVTGVGDYRLRAVQGRDGDIQITGLPLHPINETVAELFTLDAVLFALLLAIGGGAAALVVRRNLRPLQQLTRTALDVSEQELTEAETSFPTAMPVGGSGSEVDQLNIAFHRMLDRIQQALNERDLTEARLRRFVADASHELRTPLSTIRAHAEYASTTDQDQLPEATVNALARITAATGRMSTLVADLLLLARLDAGRPLAREPVDLTRLVLDAVADAHAAAQDHVWKLDLPEESVMVDGDGERLHQVLANLLANARTHTPAGTTVTAQVRVVPGFAEVSVTDDGPGIPAGLQPTIFDRFSRGDTSRSRAHGSSGLGLAIARSIVASHGGSLSVSSTRGEGTVFTMQLPIAPDQPR